MKLFITLKASELANKLALAATQYGDNILVSPVVDETTLVNEDQWVTRREIESVDGLFNSLSNEDIWDQYCGEYRNPGDRMHGHIGVSEFGLHLLTRRVGVSGEFVVTVVPPAWEDDVDTVVSIGYQSFGGTRILAVLPDNNHTICIFADGARSAIFMLLKDHFGFDVNNPEHVAATTVEYYESRYGGIGNATPYRLQWHESKWKKNPLDYVTVERYPATTLVGELRPQKVNGDQFLLGRQAGVTDVLNGAAYNTNIAVGTKWLSTEEAKELSDILTQLEALEIRSKALIDQLANKADE